MSHQINMGTPTTPNLPAKPVSVEKSMPEISTSEDLPTPNQNKTPSPSTVVSISSEGRALSESAQQSTHHE